MAQGGYAIAAFRDAGVWRCDALPSVVLEDLGVLLSDLGRWSEAEVPLREAVRLDPDAADAYRNLGAVLTHLRRAGEAEPMLRLATRLAPGAPDGHFNLGAALHDMRRLGEADGAYREALRLAPDFADAHNNRAYSLLLAGRYAEGWQEYEWRWRTRHMSGGARIRRAPMDGRAARGPHAAAARRAGPGRHPAVLPLRGADSGRRQGDPRGAAPAEAPAGVAARRVAGASAVSSDDSGSGVCTGSTNGLAASRLRSDARERAPVRRDDVRVRAGAASGVVGSPQGS